MKLEYTKHNMKVSVEGMNQKEAFKELASFEEVFTEHKCGACQGEEVRFVVRKVGKHEYYEVHCTNTKCRAKLAFGQHTEQPTLFPKRKDEDGNYLVNNGWTKYVPEEGEAKAKAKKK